MNRMEQDRTQSNIIIGFDIDNHNGEPDVNIIQELINIYLGKYIYWEKSTNGGGLHGYMKLIYGTGTELDEINQKIRDLFVALNKLAKKREIQAKLDMPCCLPSGVTFCDDNPYQASHPYISKKGYYAKISRSQALKIPKFNNSAHTVLENIGIFHKNPFYCFDDMDSLISDIYSSNNLSKVTEDITTIDNTTVILGQSPSLKTMISHTQDNNQQTFVSPTTVGTNENDALFNCSEYDRFIRDVDKLRDEQDKLKKMGQFVAAYIRLFGYGCGLINVVDIDREYVAQKLHTKVDNPQRLRIIADVLEYFRNTHDGSKIRVGFQEWLDLQEDFMNCVKGAISSDSLNYVEGKTRKGDVRFGVITYEDVAFILYLVAKTNYMNYDNDSEVANSFSCKQAQGFYRKKYERSLHPAKFCAVMRLLQESCLVERIGDYIKGVRGNQYQAREDLVELIGR